MTKNRFYVVTASKSESGYNELWERVVSSRKFSAVQRLTIEMKTGVVRKLCRALNNNSELLK